MENGKGKFPGWQNESGDGESGGSKSDAEKKKKKSKKSSDSTRRSTAGDGPESSRKKSEKEKVSKALAEFFVERDDVASGSKAERKKKRSDTEAGVVPEESAASIVAEAAKRRRGEPIKEEITIAHNRPETDDDHSEDADEKSDEKTARVQEQSKEKVAEKQWPEFELPLTEPRDEEIILPLQGDAPIVERITRSKPEPERAPEPATAEAETPELVDQPGVETNVPPNIYQPHSEQQPQFNGYTVPEFASFVTPESAPDVVQVGPEAGVPVQPAGAAEVEPPMVPVSQEDRRVEPAEAYRMYVERQTAQNTAATGPSEEMVNRQEAENAAYYAAKRAQGRGLVTGLFVAGLWGHFRRKGLKREFNKSLNQQEKQIKKMREDQHFYAEAQTRRQSEDEHRLAATQQRLTSVEGRLNDREAKKRPAKLAERLMRLPGKKEQSKVQQSDPESGNQLAVPAEHHLETSAWHTIEVDTRTGRAVEQPAFAYGHEYYQERAHEAPPTTQRNAATGEVILAALNSQSSQPQTATGSGATYDDSTSSLPPTTDIPSASRQGPPPNTQSNDLKSLPRSLSSTGPIWPYVLTLIVILICLAFLVR